mmetsp:Transcript_6062/g.10862  ORF Transcript_6062/g.10862 Transcript_6062/m.10862 type:complete len:96 (+) Transcript_6062:1192-1479(+)
MKYDCAAGVDSAPALLWVDPHHSSERNLLHVQRRKDAIQGVRVNIICTACMFGCLTKAGFPIFHLSSADYALSPCATSAPNIQMVDKKPIRETQN